MKGPQGRSEGQNSSEYETVGRRKQKAEKEEEEGEEVEQSPKKAKPSEDFNGKSAADVSAEFSEFCKNLKERLTLDQMRSILETNGQDGSVSNNAVVSLCQDMLFYGPLDRCPLCGSNLECTDSNYSCKGAYSDWSSCPFTTKDSPRTAHALKIPDEWSTSSSTPNKNSAAANLVKSYQDPHRRPHRTLNPVNKPFTGMTIYLTNQLSQTDNYWKVEIEKHGGKVSSTIPGVTCVISSPAERVGGGSEKVAEAMEKSIPVAKEAWLKDSIDRQAPQPLDAYNVVIDLSVDGKGIPWDKKDPSEEAFSELKLYGKRGVHKDSRLQEQGGKIFEKDGILFNCAFSICDQRIGLNDYSIVQLIMVPENRLYLYCKRGIVGDEPRAKHRLEEWENVDNAVNEFSRLFKELTGNQFEPWEREKKFKKKPMKFYPIDMDDGVDVRHGGLDLQWLGTAVTHCKLEPPVANFLKVFCSREVYKCALMMLRLDSPDLPIGLLSNVHLKKCEEVLLQFIEIVKSTKETGQKAKAIWLDFCQKWFTLLPTRALNFRDYQEVSDHAASALETVRDVTVASHLIGDMKSSTTEDPLSSLYKKLGCSISPVEKNSDDYMMILNYLEKTYEPIKVEDISYSLSVRNIFAIEPSMGPSIEEIKKMPHKVLLWCGIRSSSLLRYLHKGFLPAICSLPVPDYMFGKAIVCSDAAADAARYGFTEVDRPEGYLILAVASLGDQIIEISSLPKDMKRMEEESIGVKALGKKKTNESEYFNWKDDIIVPSGHLIPSGHDDSPFEYTKYAIYDPKQVTIRFLVGVKYEEKDVVMDTE